MTFNASDYVDVAERIRQFKAQFPEGSLQHYVPPYLADANGKTFIVYSAAAYRTPDDPRPGVGWAWEPVPGPTQFTRDSELQNAETSAWGRAIVALGFETKNIASANEVRNRQPAPPTEKRQRAAAPAAAKDGLASDAQRRLIFAKAKEANLDETQLRGLVVTVTGQESTAAIPAAKVNELLEAIELEAVPF